ncbi:MAG: TonB family protein [Pyrinomonadaceae bacterium]
MKHTGIDLYKAGKSAEAVRSLSQAVKEKANEKNAELWNFLGLALMANGENKDSRKAFEKAVKIEPTNSAYRLNFAYAHFLLRDLGKARSEAEKSLAIDPKNVAAMIIRGSSHFFEGNLDKAETDAKFAIASDETFSQGYILRAKVLMARVGAEVTNGSNIRQELATLEEAVGSLKTGYQKCRDDECRKAIQEELDNSEPFLAHFSKKAFEPGDPNPEPEPGVTPLKIIKKYAPGYTNQARAANVVGSIRMAVLFGVNGRVESVFVLKRLGSGLDEAAIIAARRIQFEPMKRDGVAVPVVKMMEYHFDIR